MSRSILAEVRSKNGVKQYLLSRFWPVETAEIVVLTPEDLAAIEGESHRLTVRKLSVGESKAWIDRIVQSSQAEVTEAKASLARAKARLDEAHSLRREIGELKTDPVTAPTPFMDAIRATSRVVCEALP